MYKYIARGGNRLVLMHVLVIMHSLCSLNIHTCTVCLALLTMHFSLSVQVLSTYLYCIFTVVHLMSATLKGLIVLNEHSSQPETFFSCWSRHGS